MKALAKAKKIINENIYHQILVLSTIRDCKHSFKEHGFGYLCEKCGHYTGLNQEVNGFIKQHLDESAK